MNGARSTDGNPSPSLSETAAGWLVRREEGMDEVEKQAFAEWLSAHPSHRQAYRQLSRSWEALAPMASMPRIAALRNEALIGNPPRRAIAWGAALAAATLVGAMGSTFFQHSAVPSGTTALVANKITQSQAVGELSTTRADRPTMTLVDGSKITLNSDARAKVVYTDNERRIIMLSGQAFFQVAHDRSRPFIVSVGDREVLAVGTQFDVRIDKSRIVVALLEGRVQVRPQTIARRASIAKDVGRTILEPGEQLKFTVADPATFIETADVEDLTRWREGRVRFDDTPLSQAVAEMNRYSLVPIHISDPTLEDIRISGVFRTGQSDSFLSALTQIFPISADRTEAAIELRRLRSKAR